MNARVRPRMGWPHWGLIGLLSALGLWLASGRDNDTGPGPDSIQMAEAQADYYLESFTLLSIDRDGRREFRLSGDRLIHHPDGAEAITTRPSLEVDSRSRPDTRWTLVAERARLPDRGDTVHLERDVTLHQLSGGDSQLTLTTPALTLDRQRRTLHSDSGVDVIGLGSTLQARRLEADIASGRLQLEDDTHARYAPPARTP